MVRDEDRQPAVHTAVEALLEVGAKTLPPGLEWDELDTYYRARGGAELTGHDMAHFLHQLWKTIWGERIGPHWRAAPLGELTGEKYAVSPDQAWSEKSFTAYHYQEPYVLYTDVKLEPRALSIAFSIEDGDEEEVLMVDDFPPFRWRSDKTWSGWQAFEFKLSARGTLPDLAPVMEAAAAAYSAAEEAVAVSRSSR